ncbi:MAG: NADH-quinone oxidoreductase subunit H [Candidatus Aenigmarchaeota archaeon]|nr:NADH-quinone oxidoreductase subunit H [Candidatus Aenigmarchaeota archaeon]
MIFEILIYPGFVFLVLISMIYYGILRKLAARMQSRIGPPIWQPILDFIKLVGKEDLNPEQAKAGFTLWPFIAITSVLIAGLLTPIAGIVPLSFTGDIVVLIYFLAFGSLAVYLSGFSSSNPFGVVGSMRGLIQMIGYEFPFIVSILVPVVAAGMLSPFLINTLQIHYGWFGFVFPFAAIAYFISILAKVEIPPFHTPGAHQEIVSGYSTEYTGTRLAMIELTHMIKLFVLISLGVALFFGGSADMVTFLVKSLVLLFVVTLARVLVARFRIDQILKFTWFFGLVALIDLVRVMVFI